MRDRVSAVFGRDFAAGLVEFRCAAPIGDLKPESDPDSNLNHGSKTISIVSRGGSSSGDTAAMDGDKAAMDGGGKGGVGAVLADDEEDEGTDEYEDDESDRIAGPLGALAAFAAGASASSSHAHEIGSSADKAPKPTGSGPGGEENKKKNIDMDAGHGTRGSDAATRGSDAVTRGSDVVTISGLVSSPAGGIGRAAGDRQFVLLNGRPVDAPWLVKAAQSAWRRYEMKHKPAIVAAI